MTGWLLILALLALGGVLSTLGDRLGSLVGKARLSLLGMRPRRTAVLITVLTGSLISAISLGLMLLVSERLRTGLFELDRLEQRLQTSRLEVARAEQGKREAQTRFEQAQARASKLRQELAPLLAQRNRLELERSRLSQEVKGRDAEIRRTEAELAQVRRRISAGAQELKDLEGNLIALRRGDVVLSSGQTLASAKVTLERPEQAKEVITALLQQANLNAYRRVLPGQPADRQILLVPKNDISKLEGLLAKPGSWVVSILSAANVLRGERQVLAFPDLRPNRPVVKAGEVLASTTIEGDLTALEPVSRRLNLLLAAAYARAQRQGTLVEGLQFDAASFKQLARELSERQSGQVAQLEALAINSASTADPIAVELRWLAAPAPAQSGPGPRRP
ncbi:MAG: polynucleotidyl transferase [Cyanobium sp. Baikal-G2]|nr:MAG: polynucleotidyl transferase [Cyanobium sp. Baikal-G2]